MTRRSPAHARPARPAGFTLTEVLVGVVLLALLAAGVATMTSDLRLRRGVILDAGDANRGADAIIAALERDLPATFVVSRDGEPGIVGTATSITVRSYVTGVSLDQGADPFANAMVTRFEFDRGAATLSASRAPSAAAAQPEPMSERIADLRFRYHDGDDWRGSFNSAQAGELPVAIEVVVLFRTPRGDELIKAWYERQDELTQGVSATGAAPGEARPTATGAPTETVDPFDEWLTLGRRRVIAIPDAGAGTEDAAGPPIGESNLPASADNGGAR